MKTLNPMRATISRNYDPKQTTGYFHLYDGDKNIFSCRTLELPYLNNANKISCIPEGVYQVSKITSPSQGLCFSVKNVPQREHILIHKGNYSGSDNPKTGHADILGCILVGTGFSDLNADGIPEIINSKATMEKLLSVTDGFELVIMKNNIT